jgi:hypothetical protein
MPNNSSGKPGGKNVVAAAKAYNEKERLRRKANADKKEAERGERDGLA